MSVGPDGRVLSIGTEEDLFAYGWEWKAVIWLRGHQLMHPEQPHVHRASFNYATFSVTLNSRLFVFFVFSSSLWNLDKRGGLWRLWLFSCLWERAESLATPLLLTLTLLKCALLSRKWSLHFLFFFFLNTWLLLLFSTRFLCTWKITLFHIFVFMGRAKYINGQSELCRYTGVNNSANIRPSSPMLINDNTENIFRQFYLWKAVCMTQKCFLCIILCFLSHPRDKGHWVTAQNRSRKYPVLPQSTWGKQAALNDFRWLLPWDEVATCPQCNPPWNFSSCDGSQHPSPAR